jgi:hypothetical protein
LNYQLANGASQVLLLKMMAESNGYTGINRGTATGRRSNISY